jgi:hypothetical protein
MMTSLLQDKNIRNFSIIALVFFLIATLTLFIPFENDGIIQWVSALAGLIPAAVCLIYSVVLWNRYEAGHPNKTVWGWFSLGFLLWVIGELVWLYYTAILMVELPFPTEGDYAWIVGYIPYFIGIIILYRSFRIQAEPRQVLVVSSLILVLIALSMIFVIWPMISSPEDSPFLNQFLSVAYPIGDLLIALGFSFVVLLLLGGELSSAWIVFTLGMIIMAFSDTLFTYVSWNEIYYPGGETNFVSLLTDITYNASYIVMALGIYIHGRVTKLF